MSQSRTHRGIPKAVVSDSALVIFADNDNHRALRGAENQGRYKAKKAIEALLGNAVMVEIDNLDASKDNTDWNDLIRLRGFASTTVSKVRTHRKM